MIKRVVIGVDPGSYITGVSIVSMQNNTLKCLYSEAIRPKRSLSLAERLSYIFDQLNQVIQTFKPEAMSLETIFFSKNIKALSSLAHARGVCLVLSQLNNLEIYEYSPIEVKKASVGYGRADKNQVAQMISRLFPTLRDAKTHDQTDAAAIALCHLNTWKTQKKILEQTV